MKLDLFIILRKASMISILVRAQLTLMQMEELEFYLSKVVREVIYKRV